VKVVADSHAIFWHLQRSSRLSEPAAEALRDAAASDGLTVSVATLVDLWYATQTTRAITVADLARVRAALNASARVDLHMIDTSIADAYTTIPRSVLSDPWDRFIVATARALEAPLVTRDNAIRKAQLVETVW
jgi:PIN domain nuclease of toxin-antitoxin system